MQEATDRMKKYCHVAIHVGIPFRWAFNSQLHGTVTHGPRFQAAQGIKSRMSSLIVLKSTCLTNLQHPLLTLLGYLLNVLAGVYP